MVMFVISPGMNITLNEVARQSDLFFQGDKGRYFQIIATPIRKEDEMYRKKPKKKKKHHDQFITQHIRSPVRK